MQKINGLYFIIIIGFLFSCFATYTIYYLFFQYEIASILQNIKNMRVCNVNIIDKISLLNSKISISKQLLNEEHLYEINKKFFISNSNIFDKFFATDHFKNRFNLLYVNLLNAKVENKNFISLTYIIHLNSNDFFEKKFIFELLKQKNLFIRKIEYHNYEKNLFKIYVKLYFNLSESIKKYDNPIMDFNLSEIIFKGIINTKQEILAVFSDKKGYSHIYGLCNFLIPFQQLYELNQNYILLKNTKTNQIYNLSFKNT